MGRWAVGRAQPGALGKVLPPGCSGRCGREGSAAQRFFCEDVMMLDATAPGACTDDIPGPTGCRLWRQTRLIIILIIMIQKEEEEER